MIKNLRSVVFLCVLACIALFLIGFRLGRFVATADKNYISPTPLLTPSSPPTRPITPSPNLPLQVLKDITDKNCKTTYKLASPEANLKNRQSVIYINCTIPTPTLTLSPPPTRPISPSPTPLL